jgi:casein kinase II subunit beta
MEDGAGARDREGDRSQYEEEEEQEGAARGPYGGKHGAAGGGALVLTGGSGGEESNATSEISSAEDESWVTWYCSLKGHELLCEVDPDFIDDSFNLHGLSEKVSYFNQALDIITDVDDLDDEYPPDSQERMDMERSSELLYGLVHARFILTSSGLEMMNDKLQTRDFGECLRIDCERQPLLPMGLSDRPGEATVKMLCCRCRQIYLPTKERHRALDGAFWGKTFPHLFLLQYPQRSGADKMPAVVPTIYGFRIHHTSPYWSNVDAADRPTEEHYAARAAGAAPLALAATAFDSEDATESEGELASSNREGKAADKPAHVQTLAAPAPLPPADAKAKKQQGDGAGDGAQLLAGSPSNLAPHSASHARLAAESKS